MPYWRLFYHIVWGTKQRLPLIDPAWESDLYGYLWGKATALECIPHAIGGMPDHTHVVVSIPPKLAIATVIGQLKGSSSHHINEKHAKGGTMSKNQKVIHIGILLLAFEKTVQHLLTVVFFAVNIPGIGRPDIGPTFQLSDATMVVLNAIVCTLFALGFWGRLQAREWHRPLLVGMAVFDILAEFVFHGFFFITVSVIVAVALLLLLKLDTAKRQASP